MGLRIIKATEPITVDRINSCIYAPPGVGKTTLAFTADGPLLLDFDKGSYRAANRKDVVQVGAWRDAAEIAQDDLASYRTVIVDTAGRALDFLAADIIADNPKMGKGGTLTLQGYGALKSRFAAWLKMLNTFGKDVVLIAHMDEQRNGDDIIERLDVQGGSKAEIYKSVDAMGRIFIRDKKRQLDFSPRENSFGKNPANLPVFDVPEVTVNPCFYAEVLASIKQHLNTLSVEQQETVRVIGEWRDAIAGFNSVDDFNQVLGEIRSAPEAARAFYKQQAGSAGLKFDAKRGCWLQPQAIGA